MKTSEFINQLSTSLQPMKPQPTVWVFALKMSFLGLIIAILGTGVTSYRHDLDIQIMQPSYLLYILASFGLMTVSLLLVACLTNPGNVFIKKASVATFGGFFAFVFLNAIATYQLESSLYPAGLDAAGFKCSTVTLVYAAVISLLVGFAVRKRVVINPLWTSVVLVLSGVSGALIGVSFHCPFDNALHVALWHFFIPAFVGSALGGLIGSKLLKW